MRYFLLVCVALLVVRSAFQELRGPRFVKEPNYRYKFLSSRGGNIDCSATGYPSPKITWWKKDGSPVASVPGLLQLHSNGSLIFKELTRQYYRPDIHKSSYRCLAENSVGKIRSRDCHVTAVVEQSFSIGVADEFVIPGNTAMFKCKIPAWASQDVRVTSWILNHTFHVFPSSATEGMKYHVTPTGLLLVHNVHLPDSYSTYYCRVVNLLSGETHINKQGGRLIITDKQDDVIPEISKTDILYDAKQGTTAVLPCVAQGLPVPNYAWYRISHHRRHPILENDKWNIMEGSLVINEVAPDDSGEYLCVASNNVGKAKTDMSLTVTSPLTAQVIPPYLTANMDEDAEYTCIVSGTPHINTVWLKDGVKISFGGKYSVINNLKLRIRSIQRQDAGMYQCLISSTTDMAQSSAQLILGEQKPELLYKFLDQTLRPGVSVSLKCVAAGTPTPSVSWLLDGFKIPHADRFMLGQYVSSSGLVISHMNITSANPEDGGVYECTATNNVGSVRHRANLNVYGNPHIREMPTINAIANRRLSVKCPVGGYPIQSITWRKGGQTLPINHRQEVFSNGTLILHNVQRETDQGEYSCEARDSRGHTANRATTIRVTVLPQIVPLSIPESIRAGKRATLTCVVSEGDLPLTFQWLKDSLPITPRMNQDIKIQEFGGHNSHLSISKVSEDHAGTYTCVAKNSGGDAMATAQLNVQVPPEWMVEPRHVNINVGKKITLSCQARGFPTPTVSWNKAIGNERLAYNPITSSAEITVNSNGTLLIYEAKKAHEGNYLCEANNGVGAGISKLISVYVHAPPFFEKKVQDIMVMVEEKVPLRCKPKGDPPMSVTWYKEDKLLPEYMPRITEEREGNGKETGSKLTIHNAEKSDSGKYTCKATNTHGEDNMIITLKVLDPPSPPTNLHIIALKSRSVRLGWSTPNEYSGPSVKFLVQYKTRKDSWNSREGDEKIVSGDTLKTDLQGLNPAEIYEIRVVTTSVLGKSAPSQVIKVETKGEVPGAPPLNVRISPVSSSELLVSWDPPPQQLRHGIIKGYYVGYRETTLHNSPYLFITVEDSVTLPKKINLSKLRPYTNYAVAVQAYNDLGSGPMSPEVQMTTLEDIPGTSPEDLSCTVLTSQSIRVTWAEVPKPFQNGVIKGYKVFFQSAKDSEAPSPVVTTTDSAILKGLHKFTNYTIRVAAFTRKGDGPSGERVSCTTDEDLPDALDSLKCINVGPHSLIISWIPPNNKNGIIVGYTLYSQKTKSNKNQVAKTSISSEATQYQMNNLVEGAEYEMWLTASTKVGEGHASQKIRETTSRKVAAAIISFGRFITSPWKKDVELRCEFVGSPKPSVTWYSADRRRYNTTHPKSSLILRKTGREDSGNYTCKVKNVYGSDAISYLVRIQVPPGRPLLHTTARGLDFISVQWKQSDSGGDPVQGFILNYRRAEREWHEKRLRASQSSYNLEGLSCGSVYHLYLTAYNSIGMGTPSSIINISTEGSPPTTMHSKKLFAVNSSYVTLFLDRWHNGECPITQFSINYKEKGAADWLTVAEALPYVPTKQIMGLKSASTYTLKVTATNDAGSTSVIYDFTTLKREENADLYDLPSRGEVAGQPFYRDARIVTPLVISTTVTCMAILAVCYCLKRRPMRKQDRPFSSRISSDIDFGNAKHLQMQSNIYSSKDSPTPEYADEIHPYSTFEMKEPVRKKSRDISFEDSTISATETMLLHELARDEYTRSENVTQSRLSKRRRSRNMSFHKRSESDEYDSYDSDSEKNAKQAHTNNCVCRQEFNYLPKHDHFVPNASHMKMHQPGSPHSS